jgi:hypothetical protein
MFDYVDIMMKIERKDARKRKSYICRRDTRYSIGEYFVKFCRHHPEREYLIDKGLTDKDKDVEIDKNYKNKYHEINIIYYYDEYLTIKKLKLKE